MSLLCIGTMLCLHGLVCCKIGQGRYLVRSCFRLELTPKLCDHSPGYAYTYHLWANEPARLNATAYLLAQTADAICLCLHTDCGIVSYIQVLQASLQHVAGMLHARKVAPLPRLTYSMPSILVALKQFAQARHIGKIVLSSPQALPGSGQVPDKAAAWIVTGGLGALGVLTGEWMVANSAKRIVLLGRTGR